jgi:hypothetical protein
MKEPWTGINPSEPKVSEELQRYLAWFRACYGYSPFDNVECAHCKKPIPSLREIYRCYDCDMPMHKECCKAHCKESRQNAARHIEFGLVNK